ncbi:hypothetical protein A2U01_0053795, partial [Trifolium medium]|nr:hypothetical protein [Trifolium medium]
MKQLSCKKEKDDMKMTLEQYVKLREEKKALQTAEGEKYYNPEENETLEQY